MTRSMTAYARNIEADANDHWDIEIKTLNHRFFEFSLKVPGKLNGYEAPIRDLVQRKLKRGKVLVSISYNSTDNGGENIAVDEKAVEFYLNAASSIKKKFAVKGDLSLADILGLPRIFSTENDQSFSEESWKKLQGMLEKALELTVQNRELEGGKLTADIVERLRMIKDSLHRIRALSTGQSERYLKKLTERLQLLVKDKQLDQERLHKEAAFLVERSDITEEMVRLDSHLELFHSKLSSNEEIGRELDFLCQEMNREINTLGSKSQIFEISTEVINMKKELEKVREQVQNIE